MNKIDNNSSNSRHNNNNETHEEQKKRNQTTEEQRPIWETLNPQSKNTTILVEKFSFSLARSIARSTSHSPCNMFKPHAHNLNTLLSSSSRYFRGNALIIFFFPIKCMGIHYCLCVWDVWFHVNCIDVFGISAYLHKYSMLNRQRETKRNRFAQICG